ncbi:MAG: hypothetical protein HFF69_13940 [Oscillospiraceae bacterium]|nr:hypothetical protein [Oscillospiraceae bacterium]
MRNLKKILALVLAMVMSLSLMATASAAESTAAAGDYALASKVLQGLDVVRGDEGGIREGDPITRAEVAALAYRIHTADVKDTQANLYYDLQDAAFTDLAPVSAWALGYIGYAHNAQIVKGNGNGTFNPTGNITGYEVLAMALRSIGYGKNGEFEGSEWQINTAAWARREGLLEGVSPSEQVGLDKPATRGMVFQILFNTIQHTDVQFSYVTGDLYIDATGANNTMALRLGLDKVTGVVMANEWADLENGSVMAEDKTRLKAVDGTDYTLDYASELEDIGESRTAYIRDDKTVLDLADAGNDVKDNNGEETTVKDLRGSIKVDETTEHFVNFGDSIKDYSDWLIRYVVDVTAGNSTGLTASELSFLAKNAAVTKGTAAAPEEYTRTIKPEEKIESADISIMQKIFYTADRKGINPDNTVERWVDGEVYVGTSSLTDQSDIKSWNQFKAEYLQDTKDTKVTKTGNGDWLKIIDNDNDGVAEYVLLTHYELDKVADSITKNDTTTYYYNNLDITEVTYKTHTGYEPKVGDIVLYAVIDGTVQMQLADTATAAFKSVNYKERQATPIEGDVKEQSDIDNWTKLPDELVEVDENVEYTLYLDKYGYVRAYSNETRYALITEVYPTNGMNQAWVTDRNLTAEVLKAGKDEIIKEYHVENNSYYNSLNSNYNPFFMLNSWVGPLNDNAHPNYLQPATHSLDWNVENSNHVFTYNNTYGNTDHSWTNVAKYTPGSNDNSINLYTAADRTNGEYREDYIQLALNDVSSKEPLYEINDAYYNNNYGRYVRAVDDTIFFVVSAEGEIRQYVGYSNVPDLKVNDVDGNGIHAMYAVAVNSDVDVETKNYWTANVIVIEINRFQDTYESVALIYSNDTKNSGDVKYLQVLDNAKGAIGIIPNNVDIWRGQFNAYGFYGLRNVKATNDAGIYTADIYPISWAYDRATANLFNEHGIYFGQVRSTDEEMERSTYITVDVLSDDNDANNPYYDLESTTTIRLASGYGYAWSIDDANTSYYNEADQLIFGSHGSNRVNEGDYIIWGVTPDGSKTNTVGYIVDLSDKFVPPYIHGWDNPNFLETLAERIAIAQYTGTEGPNPPVKEEVNMKYVVNGATATINGIAVADGKVEKGSELVIKIELNEGMDTLKINGNVIPAEDFVDGVYTYTVTVDADTTIEIEGSDSSAAVNYNVTFAYDMESNGGVNMWQDKTLPLPAATTTDENGNLTLKAGVDFPDVSGADYSDEMGWKLHLWIYVDGAEESVQKDPTADVTFTLTGDSTVYFYYWNQAGETGGNDGPSGGTNDGNNDDGFISGGDPEEVAARMNRGIQTLAIDNDDAAGLDTTWRAFCWVPNSAVNPGVKNADKFEIVQAFRKTDASDEPISDSVLNKGDPATHTLYVFYFKMVNGYVTPTFGDLGSLADTKAAAVAEINAAADKALAIPGLEYTEQQTIETARKNAIAQINNAAVTTVAKVNELRDNALAVINSVKAPGTFAPTITDPTGVNGGSISLNYYLDAEKGEESLSKTALETLLNNNDKGLTFTVNDDYVPAKGNVTTGNIIAVANGDKYDVVLTRVYKVTVDGKLAGYVENNASAKLTGVAAGSYLAADTVAKSGVADVTVTSSGELAVASTNKDVSYVTARALTLGESSGVDFTVTASKTGMESVTLGTTSGQASGFVQVGARLVVNSVTSAAAAYYVVDIDSKQILDSIAYAEVGEVTIGATVTSVEAASTALTVKILKGIKVVAKGTTIGVFDNANGVNITGAPSSLAGKYVPINTESGSESASVATADVVTLAEDGTGAVTATCKDYVEDGVMTLVPAVSVTVPDGFTAKQTFGEIEKEVDAAVMGSNGNAGTFYVAVGSTLALKKDGTDAVNVEYKASASATATNNRVMPDDDGVMTVELEKDGIYVVTVLTKQDTIALGAAFSVTVGKIDFDETELAKVDSIDTTDAKVEYVKLVTDDGTEYTDKDMILRAQVGETVTVRFTFKPAAGKFFGEPTVTGTDMTFGKATVNEDGSLTVEATFTVVAAAQP